MSEKIEISFEDFVNSVCNDDCCNDCGLCLSNQLNGKTDCNFLIAFNKLGITIKKPKTKLEEANEIDLVEYLANTNTVYVKRLSYDKEQVDKKISLLMAYIKELEGKK